MNPFLRFLVGALALSAGLAFGTATPALAARPDCSSNANLVHVHRRLDGAIDQLQHDQHRYGGHRVRAIGDLQNARNQLIAAEQYAISVDHDNPACFRAVGSPGGSDNPWGQRNPGPSNRNVWHVDAWLRTLAGQLSSDRRDYGGHRVAALRDIEAARAQLGQAEAYARQHGT